MNLKEIKEMINLMNENGLLELEMERDGLKIRLKKKGPEKEEIRLEKTPLAKQVLGEEKKSEAPPAKGLIIKAPMVGTFHSAPSPDTNAFVEVGQEIKQGEVICIIESMKLMNEIKSEIKGIVKEIFINNADPVEFGQELFLVEPT